MSHVLEALERSERRFKEGKENTTNNRFTFLRFKPFADGTRDIIGTDSEGKEFSITLSRNDQAELMRDLLISSVCGQQNSALAAAMFVDDDQIDANPELLGYDLRITNVKSKT